MITLKEYLDIKNKFPFYEEEHYEGQEKDKELMIEYNKALINEYPFLLPRNRWTDKVSDNYNYSYTELDMGLPNGWRIAFGDDICREIKEELVKYNFLDKYRITQIKEKWGYLHWYDSGTPVGKLSEDYRPIDAKLYDEYNIEYDPNNEVLKELSKENYYEAKDFDERFSSEFKEKNKNCIVHYGIFRIVEHCKINEIISKYEKLSENICIDCGKPNPKWVSRGWISYYCDDCAKNMVNRDNESRKNNKITFEDRFVTIGELKESDIDTMI